MSRPGPGSRTARPDPHPIHREHPDWVLTLGALALVAFAVGMVWFFAIVSAWMHGVGR